MYRSAGGKIKGMAKIFAIVGIAASILIGIALIANGSVLPGILYAVLGSAASWGSLIILYAFGEMAENIAVIRVLLSRVVSPEKTHVLEERSAVDNIFQRNLNLH